jgi:hypothetical protein
MTNDRRWAIAFAVAALVLSVPAPCAAAPSDVDVSVDELMGALGVDDLPARYVILVDRSGSTAFGRFDAAVDAVRGIVGNMGDADHLTLFAFNDELEQLFDARKDEGAEAAVDDLAALTPSGETDIRSALEGAVHALELASDDEPANVLLITDGGQFGPSPFDGDAWAGVRERGRTVTDGHLLNAYAVPMNDADGAALMKEVFPRTVTPKLPPGQFATSLRNIKRDMARRKAAAYLRTDQAVVDAEVLGPVTIGGDTATVRVRLTSRSTRLPMTVTALRLDIGDLPLRASGASAPIEVPPMGTNTVELTARRTGRPVPGLGRAPEWHGRLTVSADVTSPWTHAAAGLGVALRPALETRPAPVTVVRGPRIRVGVAILALAAAAALALAVLLLRRARQAALIGTLLIQQPEMPAPYALTLNGRRRRMRFPARRSARAMAGTGTVRARKVRPSPENGWEPELRIKFRRDGGRDKGECRAGQTETILQTDFTYHRK